ncbi:hypothetical protein OAV45_03735 [Candidatus Poseidoniales archaeon]|nr:hypothetical protein [Candidatus Poseidoniales archaeon]
MSRVIRNKFGRSLIGRCETRGLTYGDWYNIDVAYIIAQCPVCGSWKDCESVHWIPDDWKQKVENYIYERDLNFNDITIVPKLSKSSDSKGKCVLIFPEYIEQPNEIFSIISGLSELISEIEEIVIVSETSYSLRYFLSGKISGDLSNHEFLSKIKSNSRIENVKIRITTFDSIIDETFERLEMTSEGGDF